MKYNISKRKLWILAFPIIFASGCSKDFGDTNVNPQSLSQATIQGVVTSLESNLNIVWDEETFLRNELSFPASQICASVKNIGVDPVDRTNGSVWTNYYQFMANVRNLEKLMSEYGGKQEALVNVKAIKNILVAIKTLHVSDFFGDIPFSEGGYAFQSPNPIFRPKYDKHLDIYKQMLENLKWASDNLTTNTLTTTGEKIVSLGSNDVFYGSNIAKWKKLANSVLLKYAVRIVDKQAAIATPYITDIFTNNKPLIDQNEDFQFIPKNLGYNKSRLSQFRAAGSAGVRMGATIWEYLSTTTMPADTTGAAIFDYRTYVFFEKNAYNSWYPAPQIISGSANDFGDPYLDRHSNPTANRSRYAAINNFLIYDNQNVPDIILSASEVQFLKAEVYARGLGVTKNWTTAEQFYKNGITYSINFWSSLGQALMSWTAATGKPAAATQADIDMVTNHVKVKFAVTDTETDKLKKLYAQYWLSLFWQSEEALYLMRRTELTPKTTSGYNNTFYRLLYPADEKANNLQNYTSGASAMGGDNLTTKLFWMK